jgi:DNA modification methylase
LTIPESSVMVGDCRDILPTLPAGSVQCCVTSPPYWGLRSYLPDDHPDKARELGTESTPDEYVAHMVEVFREVRRVLRDDGVLWLNLGDCYAANRPAQVSPTKWKKLKQGQPSVVPPGLKPKDLVGIPWRVAFALQADGWWLRSDVVWAKSISGAYHGGSCMPESVTDRPTRAHEYLFLLAKSERYYWDAEAVREPAFYPEDRRRPFAPGQVDSRGDGRARGGGTERNGDTTSRNIRSVWHHSPQPFPGAHFAVMPPALVMPCVLSGSAKGQTILDPFTGAGTVGVVATQNGRSFVGCELNPEYAEMARKRIANPRSVEARPQEADPRQGLLFGGEQ